MNLIEYLKKVSEFMGERPSIEGFLLEHGKPYERKPLPDGFSYGPAKLCYRNAFMEIVAENTSARWAYCEGYAYTPGLIPCPHAWIVDKEDDKVIDITWRDGGRECPFCCGSGQGETEDELLENFADEDCSWCNGTGEDDVEHPSREGCEYLGIEFDRKEVIKRTVDQGYYGILERYIREQLTKENQHG